MFLEDCQHCKNLTMVTILTHNLTQLSAPSLKVSSHADHTCRNESVKITKKGPKLTVIDHNNTFPPRNSSKYCQINFFWVTRKAIYTVSVGQISALFATYCTSYILKSVGRGIKNGKFPGFPDILGPSALCTNLHSSCFKTET